MISKDDSQVILRTSLYFNELFKKTLMAAIPPEVNTKTQMDILVTLYEGGPTKMSYLSTRISIAPEQATRAVKALREKGIVVCERNPENRREVIAQLTPEGLNLFDNHTKEIQRRLEMCLENLTLREIQELVELSTKMGAILSKTDFGRSVV